MTMALLSWLSKSSSASLHRQIYHLHRCRCCYHLRHRCHPRRHRYRHPGRRHHLLGKILCKNSISTIHKCSMLLTNYNYQPCSFHFPCRLFGNKTWFSEDIMPARLVQQSIRGCTMMNARIYCCMKAVKKSTLIICRCADKAFTTTYTGFSNWKDAKVA